MSEAIEDLLSEDRTFPPPSGFKQQALVTGAEIYDEAAEDREGFWARQAAELDWFTEWDTILEWEPPYAKWFVGGKLNVAYNCLDRHVEAGKGDQVAYHWEGEPGDTRTITYAELLDDVQQGRQRPEGAGRRQGRPGRDLPARWSPSCPRSCWRAPGSGRRTRWCSPGSRRTRCGTASTTPSARCW